MTDCHVGFVDPQMFDPANPGKLVFSNEAVSQSLVICITFGPGGTYTLDLEDKYSRTVLQNMAVLQVSYDVSTLRRCFVTFCDRTGQL